MYDNITNITTMRLWLQSVSIVPHLKRALCVRLQQLQFARTLKFGFAELVVIEELAYAWREARAMESEYESSSHIPVPSTLAAAARPHTEPRMLGALHMLEAANSFTELQSHGSSHIYQYPQLLLRLQGHTRNHACLVLCTCWKLPTLLRNCNLMIHRTVQDPHI
ncbi:uncharacterized protein LOC119390999 isoform X8 [Rhipicephalus sanguineus]|uniref:uncharacterized protein LOC119390999 isoform X8 n=1 Tax=Rhipicephalus sanguineus TaxID=34632 RepID=UPI0020C4F63A|nr:uncharacterized protein LOC119390999 isoform X8 [Rhipicephalus sanguineus]